MNDPIVLNSSAPTRADAVKNRQLLIDTAIRLFSEHGVDAVTMSDVAEAAGVGKGTLYRHFPNKVDLCETLLNQDQQALQERTFARLRQGGAPCDNLRWFLQEALAFVDRFSNLLGAGEMNAPLDHPAHTWWRMTIRGLLNQARLDSPIDIDYAADVLYVMLDPRTVRYQKNRGWSYERIRDNLLAMATALTS